MNKSLIFNELNSRTSLKRGSFCHLTFAFCLVIFAFCLSPFDLFGQGPLDGYLKGKGNLHLAASLSNSQATTYFGAPGTRHDLPFKGNLLQIFAAYGLAKNLDLVATLPFAFHENERGFQDGGLYLKFRPFHKPLFGGKIGAIIGSGLSFPLSKYDVAVAGALGQRAVEWPVKAIFQFETKLGLFLNLTGGWHARLDQISAADVAAVRKLRPDFEPVEPADFTTFLVKIGFPAKHYYLDGWFEWRQTRGGGGSDYQPGVVDLPQSFGVNYRQAGGTFYYSDGGRSGFFISAAQVFSGRNVSKIRRLTGGMVFKMEK